MAEIRKIWKYELGVGVTELEIPMDARRLGVGNQQNRPVLWMLVNQENELEKRKFRICMTGAEYDFEELGYIGTVLVDDGAYVLHVFEDIS